MAGRDDRLSFALFSGGHDSLCSTHLAMTSGLADEVVHVNTGIGVEATREFVRDTCKAHGWSLTEVSPPVTYEEIVVAEGFPGPAAHFFMYVRLKERSLASFARSRKLRRGQRLVYVTGVRVDESRRRTAHVSERQDDPKRGWSWYAPIWNWSKADCNAYIAEHALPRNPVVDALHMSGECLCGSFAKPSERDEIRLWYPDVDAELSRLEARVRDAGHPACVWGRRPPNVHREQLSFEGMLCQSCGVA